MKKFVKIMAVVLSVLMIVGAFASCGDKAPETETTEAVSQAAPAASGKEYVIASDTAFRPFEYLDTATNTYVGIDMDIIAAIAADQGFKYKVNNVGFDAAMSAVQAGQADACIAGATITDERKLTCDFTDGYFDAGQIMIVAAGSDIKTLDDLKGQKVAAKQSTKGYDYAASIKDQYGFELMVLEDSTTMYQTVIQGQAVACFEDEPVGREAIKAGNLPLECVGETIAPAQYGIVVKKGENAELLAMLNAGLKNIKANGKYQEILAKYGF